MKAIVRHTYGALSLEEVDKPTIKDDEVLVRVRAASVNPYDWHLMTGTPYIVRIGGGLRRPKLIATGVDLAGVVEAVGAEVTRFRLGDEVFGMRSGSFAEYMGVGEERIALKPSGLTFEQAAAAPLAALTALQALRDKGKIQAGQQVLINGASGGVGTFAVQLAKVFGTKVTAVCSTRNVDTARSLGADRVIDYTREDFVQSGQRYDLIIDVAGNRSIADRKRALAPEGVLVLVGGPKTGRWLGPVTSMLRLVLASKIGSRKMMPMLTQLVNEDLVALAKLLETGQLTPVIERTYPLPEVPEALKYVGAGHAQGKIVISV